MASTKISIDDEYQKNFNAISASTKGSVPQNQIVWPAVALTIFVTILGLVRKSDESKMD